MFRWAKNLGAKRKRSDIAVIEQTRNHNERRRRWGKWLFAFNLIMVVVYVVLIIALGNLVAGMANFNPGQPVGFRDGMWIGFTLGSMGGMCLFHIAHFLAKALVTSFADDRDELLVRYYDVIATLSHHQEGS